MSVVLLRSHIENTKRLFLDRLTVDAQPLLQPADIDEGPGDQYLYGGVYNPYDLGIGADCSGCNSVVIDCAFNGFEHMSWRRKFSTESFDGVFPGFRHTSQQDMLTGNYPIKVAIMHGGGGPNSHMACMIDGWHMESNGDNGTCTAGHGETPLSSNYWNDFLVLDATINEDTDFRQPMSYPRGADYAGGRIPGAVLRQAGISFVCRYITPGGSSLPSKQITPDEYADLMANGIAVVFNYETTANFMLSDSGANDAQQALSYIRTLPGAPINPMVIFSADWDESPDQQGAVNNFLSQASNVLGGPQNCGIYGAYYVCKRALDAGVCNIMWQTEAWSGFQDAPHVDSRVHIMQRNFLGNPVIGGVQVDLNELHQNVPWAQAPVQPPGPGPSPVPVPNPSPVDPFQQFLSTASELDLIRYMAAQLGPGDPAWASKGMTLRDKVWSIVGTPQGGSSS
jgi:hypothetical protein